MRRAISFFALALILVMAAGTVSAQTIGRTKAYYTYGSIAGTGTGFQWNLNSLSSGTGGLFSSTGTVTGTVFGVTSNTLTSGSLIKLVADNTYFTGNYIRCLGGVSHDTNVFTVGLSGATTILDTVSTTTPTLLVEGAANTTAPIGRFFADTDPAGTQLILELTSGATYAGRVVVLEVDQNGLITVPTVADTAGRALGITAGDGGSASSHAGYAGGAVAFAGGAGSGGNAGTAAGGAGGAVTSAGGAGGAAVSTGAAGAGGALSRTAGAGGAPAGAGTGGAAGDISDVGAAGGTTSGAGVAGRGSNLSYVAGGGGATATGTSGAGGTITWTAGNAGLSTTTGTSGNAGTVGITAGNAGTTGSGGTIKVGGTVAIAGGVGAAGGVAIGGAGGAGTFLGGAGGAAATTGGAGGALNLGGGIGGAATTGGAGGALNLYTGAPGAGAGPANGAFSLKMGGAAGTERIAITGPGVITVTGTTGIVGATTVTGALTVTSTLSHAVATAPTGFITWPGFVGLTTGTDTTPINGTRWYSTLYVPYNITVTGIGYLIGTVGGTDKVIVELDSAAGANLATSNTAGVTVGTAGTFQNVAFTETVNVTGPAIYYVIVQMNGTTARLRTLPTATAPAYTNFTASASGTFGTTAAITPPTTFTADKGPVAYTYWLPT